MSAPVGDVVVRRCVVRVVRHGGWSWGPAPRLMVDRVLRALPEIVAEHLRASEMYPAAKEGGDVELIEPVRLTVRLPMAALDAVGGQAPPRAREHVPTAPPRPPDLDEGVGHPAALNAPQLPAAQRRPPAVALLDLLVALHRRGELASVLGLLPAVTRALWWGALRTATAPDSEHRGDVTALARSSSGPAAPLPADVLAALDRSAEPGGPSHADAAPELLGAVVAAAAAAGVDVVAAALRRGPGRESSTGQAVGGAGDVDVVAAALRRGPGRESSTGQAVGGAGDVDVVAAALRRGPGRESSTGQAVGGAGDDDASERRVGAAGVEEEPAFPDDAGAAHGHRGPGDIGGSGPRLADGTEPGSAEELATPSVEPAPSGSAPEPEPGRRDRPGGGRPAGRSGRSDTPARARPGVVEIASALPFLLLSPLSRLGYLDALEPALAVVEPDPQRRADALAAFATALAYTVLGPLERGWRRSREDVAAAAAFAGVDPPVPGPRLGELARTAEPALAALDAVVGSAVARGHPPGRPLLLAGTGGRAGGGLLLAEVDGLFPLVWVDRTAELLPAWRACSSPVMVARTARLPADVLRHLDAAGVSFIVDVPPTRSEHWRRLPTRSRLWTNDTTRSMGALVAQAGGFADAADRLDDLVHALAVVRQAAPLAAGEALRRSLLLGVAAALGTTAWTLWRSREPTDPLLAMERFGHLSARVSTVGPALQVRVPLGRRHADLLANGLLADVTDVPWLPGRVVQISGG